MIPLPQLVSELMLGLGAALFAANLLVLVRSRMAARAAGANRGRRQPPRSAPGKSGAPRGRGRAVTAPPGRPPSITRVYVRMAAGLAIAVWGLVALLRAG